MPDMSAMHVYETISLSSAGVVLGIWLIAFHALMLAKPAATQRFLVTFHRQQQLGVILLAIGLGWFWLLVAEPGPGILHALAMDLGEFNNAKPALKFLVPAAFFAIALTSKEFLAVRALGVVALMAAAPLLDAAFLKDPSSRLLIPLFTYALIIAALFWVGMPYTFRDAATWVSSTPQRWKLAATAGLAYGIATLACALTLWRGF